jgi:DNA polymerase-3 subunit beta
MPILTHVLIEVDEDRGTLTGTDGEMVSKHTFQMAGLMQTGGSLAVPAKMLGSIIGAMPEGDIDFSTAANGQFICQQGKIRQGINSIAGDNFPANAFDFKADSQFEIDIAELQRLLKFSIYSASSDASRPILDGINFQVSGNTIAAAATDTHRLAVSQGEIKSISDNITNMDFTMPRRLGDEILQISLTGTATVLINDRVIQIIAGNTELTARLNDGKYPPYKRLLPDLTNMNTSWAINVDDFSAALRRADIISSTLNNKVGLRITEDGSGLVIHTSSHEFGYSEEEIPVTSTGLSMAVYANAKFFLDILTCYNGGEVKISLNAPLQPLILTFPGVDGNINLISPMDSTGV